MNHAQVIAIANHWNAAGEQAAIAEREEKRPFIVSVRHDAGKIDELHVMETDSISALLSVLETYWPGIPANERPSNLKIEVHPMLWRAA
jgi:hypothetical protein